VSADDTTTLQTKITSFSRAEAAQKLAQISLRDPSDFTDATFIAHAAPVMTTIVNEGFFADVAVVVEGLSEVAALWTLQEIKSQNWDALGITIIPVLGKNNIDRPVVVFRGFGIPTFFIFDADSRHIGSESERKTVICNHILLRLVEEPPIDFPATTVFSTGAVFNDNLESEIKNALGDAEFNRVRQVVADELGYAQPSMVLKNPAGMSQFIRSTYSNGKHIPILEEIVARIAVLRKGH
jgi:predicted ATP-dependent endonuclease of OLD family